MAFPKEAAQCIGVFLVVIVSVTETSMPARRSRSNCSKLLKKKMNLNFQNLTVPKELSVLRNLNKERSAH